MPDGEGLFAAFVAEHRVSLIFLFLLLHLINILLQLLQDIVEK